MEDLAPLPSSRSSSRAPSAQSSSPELNESHLYIRDFVRETRQRLNFTSTQLPILDNHQLSRLLDGETILVPLSCSALNALASMTRQHDTITTQLGSMQQAVHTMPTWTALEGVLTPINAAIDDLSHRATAPPPKRPPPPSLQFPRLVRPRDKPLPQLGLPFPRVVHTPHLSPGPNRVLSPLTGAPHPPSTRTYPDMMWAPGPSTATPRCTRTSSLIRGKQTLSEQGSTPTPPPSSQGASPPTAPSHRNRMPRPPPLALPKAGRIRAPSQPPKSRQLATGCLPPSRQSRSPWPKEDSTLPVPPPLSTNRRP